MKFVSATINGFGKWVDASFDFQQKNSVSCLYGENESGKSTLHAFILFMLFGLPPKQRNFYRPKTSGTLGGRLTMEDNRIGRFTIERFDGMRNGAARCYTEDGMQHDEDWLKERFQGITHATYQSIYSFSANDLNDFQNMKEDNLGEVLLGIGLTGSTAIHSVEKMLDQKTSELFKPYGKKPLINQELDQLTLLHKELSQSASEEKVYREKNIEADNLSADIQTLEQQARQLLKERLELERMQQALPLVKEYHRIQSQLKELPEMHFPEDGLNRFEKWKEKALPLRSELSFLVANEKHDENRISMLHKELPMEDRYEEAFQLLKNKDDYNALRREEENWQKQLDKTNHRLELEINQLNIGIHVEDLEQFHFPFHTEKNWHQLKATSGDLESERIRLQQGHRELTNQRMYAMNQIGELESQQLEPQQITKLKEKLRISTESELIQKLSYQANHNRVNWEADRAKKMKHSTRVLWGSMIVALLLGIIAVTIDFPILYTVMAMIFLYGLLQSVLVHRSLNEMEKWTRLEEVQQTDLSIDEEERREAEQLIATDERIKKDIAALEETLKTIELQLIKWNEQNKRNKEAFHALEIQIEQQVNKYPFLQHVEIDYWPELYHSLKHIVTIYDETVEIREKMQLLENKKNAIEFQVKQFPPPEKWEWTEENMQEKWKKLEQLTEDYTSISQKINQYKQQLVDNREQQASVKQKMRPYEKEMSNLFEKALVDTEDAFYMRGRQMQEKQGLEKELNSVYRQLENYLPEYGKEESMLNLQEESDLADQESRMKTEEQKIQKELQQKRQELANIRAEISQMESSEEHSYKMHHFEIKKEKLNKLAKEWAVLKTAKQMLSETKRNYRDTYMSKVIDQTTYYFNHLTDGRYKYVYPPINGEAFFVVSYEDIRYNVNELSKGTVDQLYISLRFAVSEVMNTEFQLPMIIDDAFIHFDDERAQRMLDVIKKIANKQQVLLFTCKKDIVEFFENENIIRL